MREIRSALASVRVEGRRWPGGQPALHDRLAEAVADLPVQRFRGRTVDGDGGKNAGRGAPHD